MKKALIVFFSQGQTNMRVAEAISTGLQKVGYQIKLWNIKDGQPPDPREYDLFGIGSPTYYFRPPFNVADYVNSLPALNGLPAFVFVLGGTHRGITGNQLRQTLTLKGAREVGYFHCLSASYFLGYLKVGILFAADHPTADDLSRAETFGHEVAARVDDKQYVRPVDDPQVAMLYRLERFVLNRFLVRQVYSRLFRVNAKCRAGCEICEKQCPVKNISRDKHGRLVWGRDCLYCLSCEKNCPEDAITSLLAGPLFRPVMLLNTYLGSRDPSFDYVKVSHSKGQTHRL
jgi:flavodoxin/NAD-dependent dihydropyrimidine dehydrogenase PreA subunit